jgi:hypothetical protein
VLEARCFDLGFYSYELATETDADLFSVSLPVAEGTARVVLRQGGDDLGQVPVSSHPPTVTLIAPNGGEALSGSALVEWSGHDDDGDALVYNLFYSPDDGGTWMPVAMDITGTMAYTLDLGLVPGGASGRMRIEVSDSYHTAGDQSDGSFSVAEKAPFAGILHPEDGSAVGAPITLTGYGYDVEDGGLAGEALQWSSSRDGPLGSGDTLWDTDLSPGTHTLTLAATDSQGLSGTASISVTIVEAIAGLTAANDSPTSLGEPTTMTATVSAGTVISYAWALGDGELAAGAVVTHVYAAAGVYTATVAAANPRNVLTATTTIEISEGAHPAYLPLVLRGG